jgi:hypothetical protein
MNKILNSLLLLAGFIAPVLAQKPSPKTIIIITNPSGQARTNEVIAVRWSAIIKKYKTIDTANFKVMDQATKQELPFQLEHSGLPAIQNLLVQVSLKPNESRKLVLEAGKPAAAIQKTYARYVPERYDDFAWENDKVAFRMYGKALESKKDNAWGTDVWSKKTSKLVINDWYKTGDYHTDHGDGMDYYSVGFTLGAGDIAPFVQDSIYFSKNYHHWKVLDNGPLRSTFQLGYDAWDVAGKPVKVTKTISLDAGSQLNKVEASYTYDGQDALPVVIGIVQRKEPGKTFTDAQQGIMGYWEPQHGADGITGVGTITMQPGIKINTDKGHLLTHATVKHNQPIVYYNGAAWNKANEITTAEQWFAYLKTFKDRLSQPLKVEVL